MAESYLIEIREGSGEPGFLELKPGVELPPLGVGTEGAWRVRGAGVLGVHLYLYFDGQALFAQSADQTKPAVVNGRTIGATWTPLTAPATIALGTARLFFRPNVSSNARTSEPDSDRTIAQAPPSDAISDSDLDASSDEDRTVAVAPPVRTAAPERPFMPGAFASRSDESTRFAPIGDDEPDSQATRVVPMVDGLATSETPEIGTPAIRAMGPAAGPRPPAPVRPAAGVPWSSQAAPPQAAPPRLGEIPPLPPQRSTSPDLQRQRAAGDDAGQNATLYEPLEARPVDGQEPEGPFPPRPPPGYPSSEAAPPTPLGPPPGLLNVPPPAPPPPATKPEGSRLAREWRAAPPVRKILYVLLLPALGGAFWVILSGNEPPPAQPKAKSTPSADAAPSSSGGKPPGSSSAASPTSPSPATSSSGPEPTAPPASAPTPPSPPPSAPSPPPPSSHRPPEVAVPLSADAGADADRRERTAADYVATGQYELAAQIYDQLAASQRNDPHPNPAFAEAARILRMKLDAGIR